MSWDIFSKSKIQYFLQKLKDKFVQKETGKGLSTNDFTNEDKALIGQTLGNNTVLTTDKTPFLTRQTLNPTGFSGYVREKLVGASYAWNNQLVNGNFASSSGWNFTGGSVSYSSNKAVISWTGSDNAKDFYRGDIPYISGHKYIITYDFSAVSNVTAVGFISNANIDLQSISVSGTNGRLVVLAQARLTSNATLFQIRLQRTNTSAESSITISNVQLVDLTLAFGSTIADYLYGLSNNGGITKLRDMGCPIDKYTPYGYGLYSVKTSGKVVGSANLFDEEYPSLDSTIRYRGIYLGVGTYTMSSNASESSACALFFLDGNVSTGANNNTNGVDINHPRTVFSESGYVTVAYRISTVNPTNANTQIERGSTPTTYEKSWHTTYSLGNDELRGKFDLVNGGIVASGDVKQSNGEIDRTWKEIDLGSLDYQRSNNAGNWDNYLFYVQISDMANYAEKRCAIYTMSDEGIVHVSNKCITRASNNYLYIRDDSYTDTSTFKTAMNGVKMIYPLATSTTEQSTPFADPMSLVGATTEEYIDIRDIPCPVGAERQYMGQSEDVVEIPSSPQSDGKRKLVAETSGGKTQYYWGKDIDDNINLGTSIDLTPYYDTFHQYTFPLDGYIFVSSEAATSGYIRVAIRSGDNKNIAAIYMNVTGAYQIQSVFVKQGMSCFIQANNVTGSIIKFNPLV